MNAVTRWAKAALDLPNFTVIVIDSTGINPNSDMIRLTTIDRHGNQDADIFIGSGRGQSANTLYTGIEQAELDTFPHLADVWPEIAQAIAGNYFAAYGMKFIRERLDENARNYGLPELMVLGVDVMDHATRYFQCDRFPRLADACRMISHPLPQRPDTLTRARAVLAIVKRMAAGPYTPLTATDEDFERPF